MVGLVKSKKRKYMTEISSDALIKLALGLSNSLSASDRFERLLNTVRQTIECDAVVLLRIQADQLKPLAHQGLNSDVLGRRFEIGAHPRFEIICNSTVPVRFASNNPLPDPYDGMLLSQQGSLPVHACMGLPLLADNQLIGVLTLDSMQPNIFDDIPAATLEIISAMSAATLKTAIMIQQLEGNSLHNQQVVTALTQEALTKDGGELIGESVAMQKLKREISVVAASDFSVLIEGETGVGKELVARTLHLESNRKKGPMVYVNCAALSENLIESELFGHTKGAFTGADKARAGKFSLASGGTIFLDEIGELPLQAQSKLLRVLQSQEIQPVGQDRIEHVNVRVLAATNRTLKDEVEAGRFRADLYHRLSAYPIVVPALRERQGDVSLLAGYFAEQLRRKLGLQQLVLEPAVLEQLGRYDWPGNIRELEHLIGRAALRARASAKSAIISINTKQLGQLEATDELPQNHQLLPTQVSSGEGLKSATEHYQRQLIQQALEQAGGNWTAAAKSLKVDRANLTRLAKRLGIQIKKSIIKQD